jgi:hypothetical protein
MSVARVGVCDFKTVLTPDRLKRYAFLLDQVRVISPTILQSLMKVRPDISGDVEFLVEQQFLTCMNLHEISAPELSEVSDQLIREQRLILKKESKRRARELSTESRQEIAHRYAALILRARGIDALCVGDIFRDSANGNVDRPATRETLYEIIIDEMAVPDEHVPWEEILSFRADATAQQQLRMLRLWVSDVAKGELTHAEAADKIAYLKSEYRECLKHAELRFGMSTIRTLVVGAAELVENLVKLRLKSLAEAPFKIFDARTELLKEEREALGRELQYLVHVGDAFTGR